MPRLSSLSSLPFNPILKIAPFFATLIPNITSVNEGASGNDVVFTASTRNIPNGTLLNWDCNGSYYSFAPSYGTTTVNNGVATFTVRVASDDIPEASETFTVSLWDENYNVLIATSSAVSIVDFGWNTTINIGWTVGTANLNGAAGWTPGIIRDAFYDGTRYVVCGSDAPTDVPVIGYSTDAVTWTTVTLSSAIFGINRYLECGASNGSGTSIVMSTFGAGRSTGGNLASWTDIGPAIDSAGLSSFQEDIIWNGTYFMATGSGGSANFVRSADGATWTGFSGFNTAIGGGGYVLAANGSTVVAIGGFGVAAISTDHGATWSSVPGFATALGATVPGHGIAYGGGSWVYVGGGSGIFMNSTDGITWTKRTKPQYWSSSGTNQIIYKNGIFIVAGNSNNWLAYSVDGGTTWRKSPSYNYSNTLWSLTADNDNTVLALTTNTSIPITFSLPAYPT